MDKTEPGPTQDSQLKRSLPSWWTVLIADPDPAMPAQLMARCADAGGTVIGCQDGASALFLAGRQAPDVVLLAAVLPGVPVDVVVPVLREHLSVPILLAVGPGDAEVLGDRLGLALVAGANEVITRPYTHGAGLAQFDAHVDRLRFQREADVVLSLGALRIDVARFEARVGERTLPLTVREFRILYYLMSNYERAVSGAEIQQAVWAPNGETVTANTLAVHINRLRKTLGDDAQITNIRRIGYRLSVP